MEINPNELKINGFQQFFSNSIDPYTLRLKDQMISQVYEKQSTNHKRPLCMIMLILQIIFDLILVIQTSTTDGQDSVNFLYSVLMMVVDIFCLFIYSNNLHHVQKMIILKELLVSISLINSILNTFHSKQPNEEHISKLTSQLIYLQLQSLNSLIIIIIVKNEWFLKFTYWIATFEFLFIKADYVSVIGIIYINIVLIFGVYTIYRNEKTKKIFFLDQLYFSIILSKFKWLLERQVKTGLIMFQLTKRNKSQVNSTSFHGNREICTSIDVIFQNEAFKSQFNITRPKQVEDSLNQLLLKIEQAPQADQQNPKINGIQLHDGDIPIYLKTEEPFVFEDKGVGTENILREKDMPFIEQRFRSQMKIDTDVIQNTHDYKAPNTRQQSTNEYVPLMLILNEKRNIQKKRQSANKQQPGKLESQLNWEADSMLRDQHQYKGKIIEEGTNQVRQFVVHLIRDSTSSQNTFILVLDQYQSQKETTKLKKIVEFHQMLLISLRKSIESPFLQLFQLSQPSQSGEKTYVTNKERLRHIQIERGLQKVQYQSDVFRIYTQIILDQFFARPTVFSINEFLSSFHAFMNFKLEKRLLSLQICNQSKIFFLENDRSLLMAVFYPLIQLIITLHPQNFIFILADIDSQDRRKIRFNMRSHINNITEQNLQFLFDFSNLESNINCYKNCFSMVHSILEKIGGAQTVDVQYSETTKETNLSFSIFINRSHPNQVIVNCGKGKDPARKQKFQDIQILGSQNSIQTKFSKFRFHQQELQETEKFSKILDCQTGILNEGQQLENLGIEQCEFQEEIQINQFETKLKAPRSSTTNCNSDQFS